MAQRRGRIGKTAEGLTEDGSPYHSDLHVIRLCEFS
jgi:hypothetical protein